MPHGQVDWAALAQQWIKIKEVPGAEGAARGEEPPPGEEGTAAPPQGGHAHMQLCGDGQKSGGWDNSGWNMWQQGAGMMADPSMMGQAGMMGMGWGQDPSMMQAGHGWHDGSGWPADGGYAAAGYHPSAGVEAFGMSGGGGAVVGFGNGGDYMETGRHVGGEAAADRTSRPSRSRRDAIPSLMELNTDSMLSLNDDQRKKLPPWIREGLEKMERDKRKKEEEDRRRQRTEEKKRKRREEEAARMARDPTSSKFDESGGSSEDEKAEERPSAARKTETLVAPPPARKKKSRFDADDEEDEDKDGGGLGNKNGRAAAGGAAGSVSQLPPPPQLSKEEQLEQMSLSLRRILTSVLLEVTGQEIGEVCAAVVRRHQARGNGKPQLKSMLSGYGSDSDSHEGEGEDEGMGDGEEKWCPLGNSLLAPHNSRDQ